jgi:hypothetical protein
MDEPTKRIAADLTPAEHEYVRLTAIRRHMTVKELVRIAVLEYTGWTEIQSLTGE